MYLGHTEGPSENILKNNLKVFVTVLFLLHIYFWQHVLYIQSEIMCFATYDIWKRNEIRTGIVTLSLGFHTLPIMHRLSYEYDRRTDIYIFENAHQLFFSRKCKSGPVLE